MRTRILAVGLTLLAACGGVLFNQSNAFPCDFSQAPGERDAVCAPGDVCGVDNHCQRYVNEGPRFEGAATLPDFSADAGSGQVLHPLVLGNPTTFVGQEPKLLPRQLGRTWVSTQKNAANPPQAFAVASNGKVEASPIPDLPADLVGVDLRQAVPLHFTVVDGGAPQLDLAALVTKQGDLRIVRDARVPLLRDVAAVRGAGIERVRAVAFNAVGAGFAYVNAATGTAEVLALPSLDGGTRPVIDGGLGVVADVGWVSRPDLLAALVVTRDDVWLWREAAWNAAAVRGPAPGITRVSTEPTGFDAGVELRIDPSGSVVSMTVELPTLPSSPTTPPLAVSTWQLTNTGGTWSLRRLWSDCSPCPLPASLVVATPAVTSRGAAVDALCKMSDGLSLVRVTGSAAGDAYQACVVERLPLPFNPAQLVDKQRQPLPVVDLGTTAGLLVAGTGGQLWAGDTLGDLLPTYLDRVPLDVDVLTSTDPAAPDGRMLALTSTYLARLPAAAFVGRNGFTRLGLKQGLSFLGGIDMPTALVRGGQGWVVLPTGDLALMQDPPGADLSRNADPTVRFGPRLVDGNGEPLTTALGGVALTGLDGGVLSAVVASGDSLSFVPLTAPTTDAPGMLGEVSPQVTPEPGNRIRSFAVEMTPIATNGVDRVRGALVTSRNVYRFELSGSPPRWSATPLALSGGEPLETWMDNPRGGLGRVGYRDGRVFTLPGGFQLVEALGGVDGGSPPQVLDYENLGGWPVAYTSMGLFVARWDTTASGALESHFADGGVNRPMTWRKVTLPDGKQPWMHGGEARAAKLFVKTDPQVQEGSLYSQTFTLMVFLDDQVLQVGQHVRTNKSARVQ